MGARDAEEMLEACQAQSVIDERHIATLTEQVAAMAHRIAAIRVVLDHFDDEQLGKRTKREAILIMFLRNALDAPSNQETAS